MEDNTPPIRLPVCGPTPLVLQGTMSVASLFVRSVGLTSTLLVCGHLVSHMFQQAPPPSGITTVPACLSRLADIQRRAASSTQAALEPSGRGGLAYSVILDRRLGGAPFHDT